MAYDWKLPLFSQLSHRAEARGGRVRFPVCFQGRPERRVEVALVDDSLRVRVSPEVIHQLESLDADAYLAGLKDELARRTWQRAADAVMENRGATVNLHTFSVAVCAPLWMAGRRSPSLTIYESWCADPEDLAGLLEPKQIAQLRALAAERERPLRLREIGELLFPHPAVEPDDHGVEEEPAPLYTAGEALGEAESAWARHRNVIFFGPPGTGKSYTLQRIVEDHLQAREDHVIRVTFHPEYSYFDFVGSYKPAVGWLSTAARFHDADGLAGEREPRTYYRFEPGPLSRALELAAAEPDAPVVLVIEEINRGNTAAIFGDVFQLLDRTAEDPRQAGWSEYPVHPAADWAGWLASRLPRRSPVFEPSTGRLRLPPNLYLYATMNTSDQGLYPMDTAFRRRWGMSYRGVDSGGDPLTRVPLHARDEVGVPWISLMAALNELIVDYTRSDDKQLGPWFIRPNGDNLVEGVEFVSKVLFYLWADVFRDEPTRVFRPGITTYERLVARYEEGRSVFTEEVLARVAPGG
jgi:hypothetical protein